MKKALKQLALLPLFCGLLVITSCNKDDKKTKLETTQLSMKWANTAQIVVSPNANGVTFTSSNESIAGVSATGLVTARRIGTATITVKKGNENLGTCRVTITESYPLKFRAVYLTWNASKSSVKSYESRILDLETTTGLRFRGENSSLTAVAYTFSGGRNLNSAGIQIPTSELSYIRNHIRERSLWSSATGDFFMDYNGNTSVAGDIQWSSSTGYVVVFIPSSSRSSSQAKSNDLTAEQYKAIIQEEFNKFANQFEN